MKDNIENIIDVNITESMREKYREYATTVVVSRALPDVRDGFKPVHRRIIYAMFNGGYDWTKGYSKSARIVGDVMGQFHPHGDSSIYEAMARLAQPWSMSAMLIDGQGNFGSPDGDAPAAMRYTEARMSQISKHLVDGLRENTVDFVPNYDGKDQEPSVLPASFPNILVNAGSGIAVGMASDMPTHNLSEVVSATVHRMKNPNSTLEEVMEIMPAPDFPTAGRIIGTENIRKAYETGRGTLLLEATTTPDKDGRNPILVYTDMPFGVSKTTLLSKIKDLMESGAAPEIVSARDESGRTGVRFVVEMKAGSDTSRVDALLKAQTPLRTTIGMNMTMLDQHGVPREMPLLDILDAWIWFRRITVRRRLNNELKKLRDNGRMLLARMVALSEIDKVIKMIRASKDKAEARDALMSMKFRTAEFQEFIDTFGTKAEKKGKTFSLTSIQADHILEMRIQRLTGMERDTLIEEAKALIARMREIREILSSQERVDALIISTLEEIRKSHGCDRRTEIDQNGSTAKVKVAPPPVKKESAVILINARGELLRAGKVERDDYVQKIETDTHSRMTAFTVSGQSFAFDISDIPSVDAKEDYRSLTGILGMRIDAEVASYLSLNPETDADAVLTFVSADGYVRRTQASEFFRIPQPGKVAMNISDTDAPLLNVFKEEADGGALFMGTAEGKFIRFSLGGIRVMAGRGSRGVRGMKLVDDDRVVSAFQVKDRPFSAELVDEIEQAWLGKKKSKSDEVNALLDGPEIIQISEGGYAKRTLEAAYRQTNRDNKGSNDRGPAKSIGKIKAWGLVEGGAGELIIGVNGEVIRIDVSSVKKGAKATTGGKHEL